MELGQILRKLRKERKMTQQELAKATGLSFHAINSYESGRREPNSKAMAVLERFFNVSGEFLRGEVDRTTFIENSNIINDELDQMIVAFQKFKSKYAISNQAEQMLAANILTQIIKLVTDSILNNDSEKNFSVSDIVSPFSAVLNLNTAGIQELNKRADELQQLLQYKK